MKRLFALSGLCAVLLAPGSASADTLNEALAIAYQNNPQLAAQKQETAVAQEQLEQARSARRPTVNLSSSIGYESIDTNRPISFTAGDRPVATARLQSEMPIYTSGRISAGIDQAKANIGAVDSAYDSASQDLILQVVTAYVDVRSDRETVRIRESSVALLTEQVRAARDRFDVGEVTRTDVAQAEARLEGALAALAGANAALEGTRAVYAFLVGKEAGELEPPPPAPLLPASFDEALDSAMRNNPDIQASRFREEAASEGVRAARGASGPSVSLVGTASAQETYDDNYRDTEITAVARATIPLYQGGLVDSQVRAARLRRDQARFQTDNLQRQVRANVAQAWFANIAAKSSIEASLRQVEAAEIAYEGAKEELAVGVRTTLDVLDQEQQLLEARLNLIQSERDAYVAAHQLLRAMGGLSVQNLAFPG
ncbi:MAG: TolC family outer membrane protein [Alphaproteobacteria bacterium]|nr:TolC family outer membrane protein [Alphaproteobacteria bacterium]